MLQIISDGKINDNRKKRTSFTKYLEENEQSVDYFSHKKKWNFKNNETVKKGKAKIDIQKNKFIYSPNKSLSLQERRKDINLMLDYAKESGWTGIKVKGDKELRQMAWFEASIKGLNVKGYNPSKEDKKELERYNLSLKAKTDGKDASTIDGKDASTIDGKDASTIDGKDASTIDGKDATFDLKNYKVLNQKIVNRFQEWIKSDNSFDAIKGSSEEQKMTESFLKDLDDMAVESEASSEQIYDYLDNTLLEPPATIINEASQSEIKEDIEEIIATEEIITIEQEILR